MIQAAEEFDTGIDGFRLRAARPADCSLILDFIRELADYEKLSHEVVATPEILQNSLFGDKPVAEVVLGFYRDRAVSCAIFFHNFSTFLGKPGLYLEDLYVRQNERGRGFGRAVLKYLAWLAVARGCGRMEWSVLDWNEAAIRFYETLGAEPTGDWTVYRLTGGELESLAR